MDCGKIDKIYILRLLQEIEKSIEDVERYASKSFDSMSEADRYAVRYGLIVLAEALFSLAIHIARRLYNERPEAPVHSLRILRDRGLVSVDEYDDFVKLLKLRNLLVHRYWVIDDRKIYDSVKKDFRCVRSFLDRVRRMIEGG